MSPSNPFWDTTTGAWSPRSASTIREGLLSVNHGLDIEGWSGDELARSGDQTSGLEWRTKMSIEQLSWRLENTLVSASKRFSFSLREKVARSDG
jgi:hypothetical protein